MIDLAKRARPWTAEDGALYDDWAQRELGEPVVANRIEQLIRRFSIFSVDGLHVMRLWDPEHEQFDPSLVAGFAIKAWSIALSPASRTPIESGYLECMKLEPSDQGDSAADAIAAFTQLQLKRYGAMERHLVECYGTLTREQQADSRFHYIDYPGFDSGPVRLGLGIYGEHVRYRHAAIWVWSRAVNWHK